MQQIILKPLYHRVMECMGVYFDKDPLIQALIQREAGARWSKITGAGMSFY